MRVRDPEFVRYLMSEHSPSLSFGLLAAETGIPKTTVYAIAVGGQRAVYEDAVRIARVLRCPVRQLFEPAPILSRRARRAREATS